MTQPWVPPSGNTWVDVTEKKRIGNPGGPLTFSEGDQNKTDVDNAINWLGNRVMELLQMSVFVTGDIKPTMNNSPVEGWLPCDHRTIGTPMSAADWTGLGLQDLFYTLWVFASDLDLLTSSGTPTTKGATAAADWGANKRLYLPDMKGRVICGTGQGTGLTDRILGQKFGVESSTIPHTHGTSGITMASALGSYTPSGTVTITPYNGNIIPTGTITVNSALGQYTPEGNVTILAYTGSIVPLGSVSLENSLGPYTPTGTVTVDNYVGNITPLGTISINSSLGSYTPSGTVTVNSFSGNITPLGTITIDTRVINFDFGDIPAHTDIISEDPGGITGGHSHTVEIDARTGLNGEVTDFAVAGTYTTSKTTVEIDLGANNTGKGLEHIGTANFSHNHDGTFTGSNTSINHGHTASFSGSATDLAHTHTGSFTGSNTSINHGHTASFAGVSQDFEHDHTATFTGSNTSISHTHNAEFEGVAEDFGHIHTATFTGGSVSINHTHTGSFTGSASDLTHTHTLSGSTASASPTYFTLQPTIAVNFIIKI